MNEKNEIESSPSPSSPMPSSNRLRVPVASSERRFRTLIPIGLLFIVVLIILGTLTPLDDTLMQHISSSPSPVPTIAPGDDLFYIRVAPNWGAISIDGHEMAHIPAFPPASPLLLSRGVHTISWHVDPFFPKSCTVYIPSLPQKRCPYESAPASQSSSNRLNARVIEFDASLRDLPYNQRSSLVAQTQVALNALQSATTIQTGELYARLPSPQVAAATATPATQPLHALLRFHLDLNPNSNRTLGSSGTNCLQFCTSIYDQPSGNPGQHIWIAEAPYYPGWDYRTFSGQVVAQGQPDSTTTDGTTTDYAAYFDIQWVNQAWHVVVDSTILHKPTLDSTSHEQECKSIHNQTRLILVGCAVQESNNPACASLRDLVFIEPQYSSTLGSAGANLNWSYVVVENMADGCLGIIVPKQGSSASRSQVAYCLYRFGVLLTANALAHHYWPDLPMADSYEQQFVQQTAATIGL